MDSIPQKICSQCQRERPATPQYFDRDKQKIDGLDPRCKECRKTYRASRKEQRHARVTSEEHRIRVRAYRKTSAQREHAREYAKRYRQSEKAQAYLQTYRIRYREEHKEEILERSKRYYHANRERQREYKRKWIQTEKGRLSGQIKKHKRKAQKLASGGSYTAQQIQEQLQRQRSRCYYCKIKIAQYHIEHIVPLARGGSNEISNIVLACPSCNMSKHDKLPHEWHRGGHLL